MGDLEERRRLIVIQFSVLATALQLRSLVIRRRLPEAAPLS